MDFFSTQNILVHIPIGAGGYDLSWIEAVGTIAGLLCIWLASLGEDQQLCFGAGQRHLVCHYFLSDSAVCQPAAAGVLLLPRTFTAGMHGRDKAATMRLSCRSAGCRAESAGLAGGLRGSDRLADPVYQSVLCFPDADRGQPDASIRFAGHDAGTAAGCFPVLGFLHDGVIYRGNDSDDPQVCGKLAVVGDYQRD